MTTLHGQRVVVLGGTSGIGLTAAKAALVLEAEVVVTGRDAGRLPAAADERGAGAPAARVDTAGREHLESFLNDLGMRDHHVRALNRGTAGRGSLASLDLSALQAGFEGTLWPCLTALQVARAILSLITNGVSTVPVLTGDGGLTLAAPT